MQKSHSKNERLNFVENGTKLSEPNIDKLTRKMENFEKILTHLDEKISVFEVKSKKKQDYNTFDRDSNYKSDTINNEISSKVKSLEAKVYENKEFLTGRIDEVEKKLRAIIIRVDDIQENFRNSMKLEKRLANIEKTLENVSINRDKTKEKNDEHFFKSNTKTKDEPIKNVYEPSTKYSVDYSKNFYENKTEDLKNSRDFAEISNVKNGRDMNKRANRKEKNKSIKDDNFDYYKNGNRDIKEYELKNESKYSQLFNKISTERPYLQDSNNYENKIFKESKNLRNNLNGGEEILSSFPKERTNKPDHQKSHSFYLNPEEENLKKKNHSSIENVEKQEKRKKIDEEIDKRLNVENERRQKLMGSFENKKKIDEKFEDYNKTEEDKFRFSPFSTEKSRTKEISSRLKLENKIKDDKITKITYSLFNK